MPFVLIVLACLAFSHASVALAQTDAAKAPVGVVVSISSAYDDNVLSNHTASVDPAYELSGLYSELNTRVGYYARRDRLTVGASGGTVVRQYPHVNGFVAGSHVAEAGVGFDATRRTTLHARLDASVAPYLAADRIANLSTPDFAIFSSTQDRQYAGIRTDVRSYDGRAEFAHNLTRRDEISAGYSFRRADSPDQSIDFGERAAIVQFGRRTRPTTAIRVTYAYRSSHYGARRGGIMTTQDLGFGIERAWRHSKSRATTVDVTTGAVFVDRQQRSMPGVIGTVSVTHQVSKTWNARVAYRRALESIVGFGDVSFSDSVNAGVTAELGRRWRLGAAAAASVGQIGFEGLDNAYYTRTASVRLSFNVNRRVAVDTEYLYYRFKFGAQAALPSHYVRDLNRRSARIGITLSMPMAGAIK